MVEDSGVGSEVCVHLAMLNPGDSMEGMRRLLKWGKLRDVPNRDGSGQSRQLFAEGMLCEIDDADLEEARSFCSVEILASKGGARIDTEA